MRFLKRRRRVYGKRPSLHEEDPLSSVANLFDVAMVFAVGLLVALISAYHLKEMLLTDADMTIVKNPNKADMEIITKKGKEIKVEKLTKKMAEGEGMKLGIAYKLMDGRVIYIPEEVE